MITNNILRYKQPLMVQKSTYSKIHRVYQTQKDLLNHGIVFYSFILLVSEDQNNCLFLNIKICDSNYEQTNEHGDRNERTNVYWI